MLLSLHQWTPLHIAVKRGRNDIVKYLVDNKADVNIQDADKVCETTLATVHILSLPHS